jgi:spore coat polysaccharide biosynthesis protein SpsF
MKIVTLIQARISSTRLPGKVMFQILGKPLLIRMIERLQNAKLVNKLVVITSENSEDDIIETLCKKEKIECFRGSLYDLLDRHFQAAKKYKADAVVKIPSDCPLIDPKIVDKVLKYYLDNKNKFDYVSNLHPATYPDGNDVEIMSFDTIEKAWKESTKRYEREHTTPYIWENSDNFRIGNVIWESGLDYSHTHRWTIDYKEDYLFIKRIFDELYTVNPCFSIYDILKLLEQKPEIKELNDKYVGTYWYDNYMDGLKNITEYKIKKKSINN